MKKIKNIVFKTESAIAKIEQTIIVVGLSTMIFFGALQVILRNFFNSGIDWADLLVRALVLWLGFVGASLATRRGRHISIDAVSKLVKSKKLQALRAKIVGIISLILCLFLFKAAIDFTLVESQSNMTAFLGIPVWIVFIVVPISLGLISLRLLISLITGQNIEGEAKRVSE
jgi:C4-dicarboxylate transporter, DctQ subunit